jgi:hypothetical protein
MIRQGVVLAIAMVASPVGAFYAWRWPSEIYRPMTRALCSNVLQHSTAGVAIDDLVLNYGVIVPAPQHLVDWHEASYGAQADASDQIEQSTERLVVSTATTLPGVLAQTWDAISKLAGGDAQPGVETMLLFPTCEALAAPGTLEKLMDHLETCKDVCERFGATVRQRGGAV